MLELKKDEKQVSFNIGNEVINVDACKSTYKKQSIITAALQNAYNEKTQRIDRMIYDSTFYALLVLEYTDIEIKDAEDIEKVEGFEDGAGKIKVSGVSKAKDCSGALVIYNGKVVEEADITAWLAKNEGMTVNDLYTPEKGSIKLKITECKPTVYSAEKLHKIFACEPENAEYTKDENGHLLIDEEQAVIVRSIFR